MQMLVTCVAILAVDFNIFPRRYAKTETYGASLVRINAPFFTLEHMSILLKTSSFIIPFRSYSSRGSYLSGLRILDKNWVFFVYLHIIGLKIIGWVGDSGVKSLLQLRSYFRNIYIFNIYIYVLGNEVLL